MKTTKLAAVLLFMLLGPLTATVAHADRGHFGGFHGPHYGFGLGVGVGIGVGLASYPYGYGYYPYGYGYYPYGYPYASYPVVVTQPAPTTYVQQNTVAPAPAPQPSNDWYYCRNPAGYYPYVQSCPNGWQRVPAQPPQN